MGQIIELPPSRGSTRGEPAVGGAEILFFMGVRYHRMSDEDFAAATARKPRRAKKAGAVTPRPRRQA